ncbi:TonB-dependent siderophore receptor [Pseudomonas sp. 148P]|uniref:TonB-dependent siderophore receptor n=1 Tax=Pseudomonas ulcerans TaxID=3115852 RepID=A0ABU7I084_9PSED|nr:MULTISPECIES: TonB-dependent siderophore receptor [unclassified Pseudomonas]MEE1925741.1 TonB-dependent siderophore receptor [Pseudomonas sp. 147P]MEE1937036.1 TonB-dependent siderophore receptor [Pseudomonas sp. 148P]
MQRMQRRASLPLALLLKHLLRLRPAPLLAGGLLGLAAVQVQAQEVSFDIPAQPLWSALQEWGRQSDLQVLVNPDDIQGKTSPQVRGRYSPEQAAHLLLRNTGIDFSLVGDTLTLQMYPTTTLLDMAPTSISAEPIEPTTEGSGSYTTPALTIGKSTQSLRETPQSVTVMTRQLMDDRNLTSLDQVLAQTPGMTFGQRNYGSHLYLSRGFVVSNENYMMDGIPGQAYNPTAWMPNDMAIYDRVEVLRGAAGLLLGAGSPGGAVNLVRKHATTEPRLSLIARAGSWDSYRLDLDAGGKFNDTGTVRGRLITAYEDKGSYLDEKSSTTPLLYGIVDIDLDDDTTLTASLRQQSSKVRGYSIFGLPRYSDGKPLDVPRATALVQDWNLYQSQITEVFGEITHRFNDDWNGKLSLIHSEGGFHQSAAYARGIVDPLTGTGAAFRGVEFRHTDIDSTGIDSVLDGHFELFGQSHQVTTGVNWSRQDVLEKRAPMALNIPIDLSDVDHQAFAKPARPAWKSINRSVDERHGVFTKANLHLSEPFSLILGARASWYSYDFDYRTGGGDFDARQEGRITPFAGVIYDLDEDWSWYASYTDIFQPQSDYRTVSGSILDPAIGKSYETGLKGELLDKRLNVAMALFYIRQEGVFAIDSSSDGKCLTNDVAGSCYVNGTVERSRGIELEASGEVLPGLQVLAGYTFNLTHSSAGGPVSAETPKHMLRASTSYTLPGTWNRLSLGAGVSAQSGYTTDSNSTTAYGSPGHAVWDARIALKLDQHWTVSLNGDNLFDRTYYTSASGLDRGNIFGDPRSYTLTLRGDF